MAAFARRTRAHSRGGVTGRANITVTLVPTLYAPKPVWARPGAECPAPPCKNNLIYINAESLH